MVPLTSASPGLERETNPDDPKENSEMPEPTVGAYHFEPGSGVMNRLDVRRVWRRVERVPDTSEKVAVEGGEGAGRQVATSPM
jgi:hypothetical protein